ncbi:MAG: hypothetical protein M3162_01495 [Thermoproteota archaeon]|nr:hypothetical protein [Thermoproteota archaeon]
MQVFAALLKNNGNKSTGHIDIKESLLGENNRSLPNFTKETEIRLWNRGR